MDEDTRKLINEIGVFRPLPRSTPSKYLKNITIGSGYLLFRVQEAAVIIDEQWTVSIHAHKLRQCISSMTVLLNALAEEAGLRVTIELLEWVNDDGLSLDRALRRHDRMERIARYVEAGIMMLVGVLLGALISWLITRDMLP